MQPQRISHYRIVGELGAGGMGEVLRAVDERLGREIALKILPPEKADQPERQLRMLREAQAASALQHPGIVVVHDVGVHDQRPFIVMELVAGETFRALAGKVTPREALLLCAHVADALAVAHANGILHRDIKSDNLMRTRAGAVKVLDFGIAKVRELGGEAVELAAPGVVEPAPPRSGDPSITVTEQARGAVSGSPGYPLTVRGMLLGTPAYMAPEQIERGEVTAASEVWSLGIVLYELLTGDRPLRAGSATEMLARIMSGPIEPPSRRAGRMLRPCDELVMRALARSPADRFSSMEELARVLRRVATRFETRRRRSLVLGASLGAIALAGAAGGVIVARRSEHEPPPGRPMPAIHAASVRRITMTQDCEEWPNYLRDNRTLVYDASTPEGGYSLFALDPETGARRQLLATRGSEWDWRPAVSPDGSRVAFRGIANGVTAVQIMSLDPPGPPRTLVESIDNDAPIAPAWSLDGRSVWSGTSFVAVRFDAATGRELERIEGPPSSRLGQLVAVDGGGLVAAVWQWGAVLGLGIVELNSALPPRWLFRGAVQDAIVRLPDGTLLATRRTPAGVDLWQVFRTGEPARAVVANGAAPVYGMALSPDARHLAWSTCDSLVDVVSVSRDGAGTTEVRPLWPRPGWENINPTAIPRSDRMLVVSTRGGALAFWSMRRDGSDPRPVPTPGVEPGRPAVSPDGATIAFQAVKVGLFTVSIDGGAPRMLTRVVGDGRPSFSRDGSTLYFQRVTGTTAEILAISVKGGEPRLVAAGANPVASPTADQLAYIDLTMRAPALLDLRTGRSEPLAQEIPSASYSALAYSDDGTRVAVQGGRMMYEVELASRRVTRFDSRDPLQGATYLGDTIVVWRERYAGNLWTADVSFAR